MVTEQSSNKEVKEVLPASGLYILHTMKPGSL
jgi:hypothetical protein